MVKVMNFNWRCFEVKLASSLLRKAKFLHELFYVISRLSPYRQYYRSKILLELVC